MRIAIPSDDLKTIATEHFGDAKYYFIFDVNLPCIDFVEVRKNTASNIEEHDHMHGDMNKFKEVMKNIPDVDAIVAYSVGPNVARVKLKAKKKVIIIRDVLEIKDVLKKIIEKLGYKTIKFDGELFYELIEVNGQKFEHAGFRDKENKFGETIFGFVKDGNNREAKLKIAIKI